MKFTTVAAAIAAAVLCSNVEAYRDKKCWDQDMKLSKLLTIQCERYQIKNTCNYEATITQPTAGDWLNQLLALSGPPSVIGCFDATDTTYGLKCSLQTMELAPAENTICGQYSIKNTCSTTEQITQPTAQNWVADLNDGKGPATTGCFTATKIY
ncbi:MAG: hypothetical protein J3Q66DRAFT_158184 [Benniella sp.]|nr:MAG: hypothetical protein J3Q66DRAFT_158184 [Benniella sp.]